MSAAGLDPAKPVPTAVIGWVFGNRSRVELMLQPHGLGVALSADDRKLLITKCEPVAGPQSVTQRAYNRVIDAPLDRNTLAALFQKANAVEFADATLIEVARKLNGQYGLVFAFDPKVDVQAKIAGKVGPNKLRQELTQLLDRLGLTFAVRSEAVVVSPKPR